MITVECNMEELDVLIDCFSRADWYDARKELCSELLHKLLQIRLELSNQAARKVGFAAFAGSREES